MTDEEAIKRLKEARNTIQPFQYVDEAIDYVVEKLEQEPFMNKPCVAHQVCHEDKVKVLDKIREEINEKDRNIKAVRSDNCCFFTTEEVLKIIDKYKAESEE